MSNMTLPSVLIEKILRDLPTKELVRTSILSKEWRYFWTEIPKVAFREEEYDDEVTDKNQWPIDDEWPIVDWPIVKQQPPRKRMKKMRGRFKLFNAIYQFLLLHQGPIVDFTLCVNSLTSTHCIQIDQILLHLSRKNTVMKLCLRSRCDLPLSIFTFHQLRDLHLSECTINNPPTTFNGFGSLTTLCLEHVDIYRKALIHILSHNPLLKSFSMLTTSDEILMVNEDEDEDATNIDLFKYLPLIEHLTLCAWDIQYFVGGALRQGLAAPLVHLKSVYLESMCLLKEDWLRSLVLIIRSSPNLEKLKLEILCGDHDEPDTLTMQEYSDIWLEHFIELESVNFCNTQPELEFVKFILAKSPVLKTLRLNVYDMDKELKLLRILEPAPHASPMVEIIGDCWRWSIT